MRDNLPREQAVRRSVALLTFAVAIIALLYGPSRLQYPAPLIVLHASSLIDSLILAATFYVSIGLMIGRRAAWQTGLVVLGLAVVWESIEAREAVSWLSLAPLFALGILAVTHRYYPIAGHSSVIGRTLKRALIVTTISTAIGCIAFFILASSEHRPFSLGFNVIRALDDMYSLQDLFSPLRYPSASHVIGRVLLFLLGVMNYTIIAFALLRPVADTFRLTPLAHARALHLLRRFGTSSEDYFKYFPTDKSYYFGQNVEGFVAYALVEGTCIALADPIAESYLARRFLLEEFLDFAARRGWQTAFIGIEHDLLPLYEHSDLHLLKIGEAARVPLAELPELLGRKNNRNIMNRFTKNGFTATMYSPRHNPRLLQELREVSDAWLSGGGRSERAFAMGSFTAGYLQQSRLFVVRDETGQAVAFASLQPNFSSAQRRASIDLMRLLPDAPTNTMDFLFLSLMRQLRHEGWQEFDLGLAPLSGLEGGRVGERGLHMLYSYTDRWFSFRGLRKFKEKFKPSWQPIHLAYTGSLSRLPAVALAINELLKYPD